MATTGTVLAKNMKIYIGSSAIDCQVNANISLSTNMFQTTCKDSASNEEFLPGNKSWTISGSGNLKFDATTGWSQLFSAWTGATSTALVFQTSVTGDKKYSGSGYISSLSLTSNGNDEAVTFDFEFQGTGALTEATVS